MNPTLAAHAAAILTILIWGATFTSTKVLLQAFAPIEILFLRFLLGACALLLACPRLLHVRDRRREVTFALAGLCGVTLYFLLENIALSYSTASNVGVLVGISPFLTALLARIVLGESLHPGFFVGFVCAMSGIVCIAVNSNAVLRLNPLGDVLALLAALTWAFYSILTRKIGDYGYNTLQVTRRIFCWGLLFMLPTLPLSGFRWGLERLAQPEMLANLLFLGPVLRHLEFHHPHPGRHQDQRLYLRRARGLGHHRHPFAGRAPDRPGPYRHGPHHPRSGHLRRPPAPAPQKSLTAAGPRPEIPPCPGTAKSPAPP